MHRMWIGSRHDGGELCSFLVYWLPGTWDLSSPALEPAWFVLQPSDINAQDTPYLNLCKTVFGGFNLYKVFHSRATFSF